MLISKEIVEALNELSKPLVGFLTENCHPYCAVVVTAEGAAVIETVLSIPKVAD